MLSSRNIATVVLLLIVSGCRADNEPSARGKRVLDTTAHHLISIADTATTAAPILSIVIGARITESGRHLVVLDAVAPFVKVFDVHGRLLTSFLNEGDGPVEMRFPTTLAVAGDTAILVSDVHRRVSMFDFTGQLRNQASLGFLPLATTYACDGWVLYGPRSTNEENTPRWLHRLRFSGTGEVDIQSTFRDPLAATGLAMGIPYGFVVQDGVVFGRHNLGEEASILEWHCDSDEPRTHLLPPPFSTPPATLPKGGGAVRSSGRAQAGIAATSIGIVAVDLVHSNSSTPHTEFGLLAQPKAQSVLVEGLYTVRDSRDGIGVLVETSEPAPRVFLVSDADFVSFLRP